MLDLPLGGPMLQWNGLHGVVVFGPAVGLFFAVPLFTLIFQRLVLEEPLPPPLQPSLLVLVAPFVVGFTAYVTTYVTTTGGIDLFVQVLYMLTLFLLAVLLGRLRHLPHCSPFRVSWWAASFPLAASAGAAIRYAAYAADPVIDALAMVVLAIASLTIVIFLFRPWSAYSRASSKHWLEATKFSFSYF